MRLPARLGLALPALALVGASGCGGTLAAAAGGRLESPGWGQERQPAAVQLAPSATWRPAPGAWTGGVTYAPTLVMESRASPLVRHRASAEVGSARAAGVKPYGRLSVDYGTVRPGDLTAEQLLEPLPEAKDLRSYAVRIEGGVRGQVSRKTDVRLGGGVEQSAGVGSSAAILPGLTRTQLALRGRHKRTRAQEWDGGVQVSRYALEASALLVEGDARSTLRLSQQLAVSATAGGAAAGAGGAGMRARPIAGMAVVYQAPGDGPGARLSVTTRPEYDRLDGGLRQRLLAQASMDAGLWREARAGASLHWATDVAGEGELRRMLTADATLSMKLAGDWSAVLGVRAFLQGGAGGPGAPGTSEVRLHTGLSRRLDLR